MSSSTWRVARRPCVGLQQPLGQIGAAVVVQVHSQEGHVGGHVRVAKAAVELDAVEDAHAVREADGVQADVAVAVADPPLPDALLEQRPPPDREVAHVGPQIAVLLGGNGVVQVGLPLAKVLLPVAVDDRQRAVAVDARPRLRVGVEIGQAAGHRVHHRRQDPAVGQQAVHHAQGGQAAHLHRVLQDLAPPLHPHSTPFAGDAHDAQIRIGAEAAVQEHLLLAVVAAAGKRREVQEAEVHRLLHLVHEVAGQEHVGDVGLDQLDRIHWMGIGGGLQQPADQLRQFPSRHCSPQPHSAGLKPCSYERRCCLLRSCRPLGLPCTEQQALANPANSPV